MSLPVPAVTPSRSRPCWRLILVTKSVQLTPTWAVTMPIPVLKKGLSVVMEQLIVLSPFPPVQVVAGVAPGFIAQGWMSRGPMPLAARARGVGVNGDGDLVVPVRGRRGPRSGRVGR